MKKNRIKKVGIIFAAVMLCFTFVSGAAQSVTTAIVETKKALSGRITHEIRSSGKVEAGSEFAVLVPEGLLVEEICIKEGDKVERGAVLFKTSGNTKLKRAREDFLSWERKETMNLNGLRDAYLLAYEEWQRYLAKTGGWYWKAEDDQMEDELELAFRETEFKYFESCKEYFSSYAEEEKIGMGLFTGDLETAKSKTKKALRTCQKLQKEWNTAQNEYWEYKRNRERTYQFTRKDDEKKCREALEKAIPEYRNVLKDYEDAFLTKVRAIEDSSSNYMDEEGSIFSAVSGVIRKVNIKAGELSPSSAVVVLAVSSEKKQVQVQVSADMEEYLAIGDQCTLKKYGSSEEIGGQVIANITYNEKDTSLLDVTVEIQNDELSIGDMVTVEINKQSGQYSFVVPLDAIRMESGETYVLAVRETEGILGTLLITEKVSVKILEKNSDYAAIASDNVLDKDIVVKTDREVEAGSRIRKKVS